MASACKASSPPDNACVVFMSVMQKEKKQGNQHPGLKKQSLQRPLDARVVVTFPLSVCKISSYAASGWQSLFCFQITGTGDAGIEQIDILSFRTLENI